MGKPGTNRVTIVGAGLGGALLAADLGRTGHAVDVYEMRGDLRKVELAAGRSINLALSHRGICALQRVGLAERVLDVAVPMRGRMIHSPAGDLSFQPYGKDDTQVIHSVSRGGLNCILLDAAEENEGVRLHFNHKCSGVDLDAGTVSLVDPDGGTGRSIDAEFIVGADGAFSAVRSAMLHRDRFSYSQTYLQHGYKELSIPPGEDGTFRMEPNALHIWPRRSFMMIALPNADRSYTCTLFWPFEGPVSFDALKTEADVMAFFGREFPDAVPMMPTLAHDYFANPTSSLATIRCDPWHVEDRVVLIGDAAHAVVPFYGQGMNASFEDVLVLCESLQRHGGDRGAALREYHDRRKRHVDVLADLAVANFVEMRDHTSSRMFRLKKKKERWLHRLFGTLYLPLYTMATFTRMPYADAVERAARQDRVVGIVGVTLLAAILVALVWWLSSIGAEPPAGAM